MRNIFFPHYLSGEPQLVFTCRLCPFMRQPVADLLLLVRVGENRGLNWLKRI